MTSPASKIGRRPKRKRRYGSTGGTIVGRSRDRTVVEAIVAERCRANAGRRSHERTTCKPRRIRRELRGTTAEQLARRTKT